MRLEFPVKKIHAISEATMADMLPIGTEQVHVMKISIRIIDTLNRQGKHALLIHTFLGEKQIT